MRSLIVSSLLLSATAHASDDASIALGELQLELEPRRDLLDDLVGDEAADPYFRFAGFAQLTGGGRAGGDVGTGAAAAVSGIGCDFLAGTVHGRFRPFGDDQHASGEATYSVCVSRVFMTVIFDGSGGVGLAPALSARRSLWSRRYSSTYHRMTIGFGELWAPGSASRHTIFQAAIGHGGTEQTDGSETRTIKDLDFDFALYKYRHLDGFALDAIAFESDAMKVRLDDKGGVANAFMPVRLHYERSDVFAHARAGWGFTGGYVKASGSTSVDGEEVSAWSETIDSEGLPDMTELVGDVEAGARRDRITVSGRVARTFYPTFDGNIAREARVSAEVSYVAGQSRRTTVALSPFAARTRTWIRDAGSTRDVSAGAAIHFGRELTDQLRIDAIGEAALSPYARLDGDRLGASRLGGQVLVALTGRVTEAAVERLTRQLQD